jgi:hypothetical protein
MDFKYLINIYYQPIHVSGQSLVNISGVTQSMPTYSQDYYVASMPEVKIWATGSSYTDALDNLLFIATSSTIDTGNPPINSVKTW